MNEKLTKQIKDNKNKLIICGIIVAVIVLIAAIIGISVHNYRKVDTYQVDTLQFTEMNENKDVKLIAHRGYRAIAPENTLPAYEMAGQAGYWGAECDVYRTKDGVWVLHHDPKTFRLMDKSKKIEKTDYEDLKELVYERGNNIEQYPDLRICTLEEYLDRCVYFNVTPVIELKGKNNTEYYNEIATSVQKAKAEAIYISYEKKDLEEMRKYSDSKMFLLTGKIDKKSIKSAKEIKDCGIEFDASKKENTDNDCKLIKEAQSEGLETAAWNVNDFDMIRTLMNAKTYYYTTDSITY